METVVLIIMLSVVATYVLKLSCHSFTPAVLISVALGTCVYFSLDFATMQSKTLIASWLADPALMLDISVLLTLDVAVQLAFCFLHPRHMRMKKRDAGPDPVLGEKPRMSRPMRIAHAFCLWFPGILILPVLVAVLVEAIFASPGADFRTVAIWVAVGASTGLPILAAGLQWLLPDTGSRLELCFLMCLLTAALGVVATVNGRTATAGTSEIEALPLAAVIALLTAGAVAGLAWFRLRQRKGAKSTLGL